MTATASPEELDAPLALVAPTTRTSKAPPTRLPASGDAPRGAADYQWFLNRRRRPYLCRVYADARPCVEQNPHGAIGAERVRPLCPPGRISLTRSSKYPLRSSQSIYGRPGAGGIATETSASKVRRRFATLVNTKWSFGCETSAVMLRRTVNAEDEWRADSEPRPRDAHSGASS